MVNVLKLLMEYWLQHRACVNIVNGILASSILHSLTVDNKVYYVSVSTFVQIFVQGSEIIASLILMKI